MTEFGFAVTGQRRRNQAGEWEEEPCFVDCKAFNRQNGQQLADICAEYLHKGDQAYVEGHLVLEQWTAQDGSARRAHKVVVDVVQFLQPKNGNGNGGGQSPTRARPAGAPARAVEQSDSYEGEVEQVEDGVPF